jgi:serine/threonine protein kinase
VHAADRLSRFQREARMLAALNHPNIATIYGLEHSDGLHYLVMQLVGGRTLAERLLAGVLPTKEALEIAIQITQALETAYDSSESPTQGLLRRLISFRIISAWDRVKIKEL